MPKKSNIPVLIFILALLYIVSPWFFERYLYFNEVLSATGFGLLIFYRTKLSKDPISISIVVLIGWGILHLGVSLFRMDKFYYLLRNSVIIYSIFTYFIGFYLFAHLEPFIRMIRPTILLYTITFLILPVSKFYFERFGMAVLFPSLFKKAGKWCLPLLIALNVIYGVQYDSATAFLIASLYLLLLVAPGFKFFMSTICIGWLVFSIFFFSVLPNLNLMSHNYNPIEETAIHEVMDSHPILGLDGNSTWRLVLWKQVVVDRFPANLFGIGFGTPMFTYFPVEDKAKIPALPYIMGAHNSFIYLFGRLGLVYLIAIIGVYIRLFKEYFKFRAYYFQNNQIFLFWSFFAISVIAAFNPALESPIYASGYWLLLGFTARAIQVRRLLTQKNSFSEDIVRT